MIYRSPDTMKVGATGCLQPVRSANRTLIASNQWHPSRIRSPQMTQSEDFHGKAFAPRAERSHSARAPNEAIRPARRTKPFALRAKRSHRGALLGGYFPRSKSNLRVL